MFSNKELDLFNIISLPIFSKNYNKSFQKLLVKGKTLFIADSAKTVFFEEMRKVVEDRTNNKTINFDFDHNSIKKVNLENKILKQMGFSKKNIFKLLY